MTKNNYQIGDYLQFSQELRDLRMKELPNILRGILWLKYPPQDSCIYKIITIDFKHSYVLESITIPLPEYIEEIHIHDYINLGNNKDAIRVLYG